VLDFPRFPALPSAQQRHITPICPLSPSFTCLRATQPSAATVTCDVIRDTVRAATRTSSTSIRSGTCGAASHCTDSPSESTNPLGHDCSKSPIDNSSTRQTPLALTISTATPSTPATASLSDLNDYGPDNPGACKEVTTSDNCDQERSGATSSTPAFPLLSVSLDRIQDLKFLPPVNVQPSLAMVAKTLRVPTARDGLDS
jgi:hypothetical protein